MLRRLTPAAFIGTLALTASVLASSPASAEESVVAGLSVRPAVTATGETTLAVTLVNTTDLAEHAGIVVRVTLPTGVSFPVTEVRTTCANVLSTAPVGPFIEFQADLSESVAACSITVGIQGDSPGLHEFTEKDITKIVGAVRGRSSAAFVVGDQRLPLALTVTAQPRTTAVPASGRTLVVSAATAEEGGDLRVQVRCVPLVRLGRGDATLCRYTVDKQGGVTVRTFGVSRVSITVTITAVPEPGARSTRSRSTAWTRTWQTG